MSAKITPPDEMPAHMLTARPLPHSHSTACIQGVAAFIHYKSPSAPPPHPTPSPAPPQDHQQQVNFSFLHPEAAGTAAPPQPQVLSPHSPQHTPGVLPAPNILTWDQTCPLSCFYLQLGEKAEPAAGTWVQSAQGTELQWCRSVSCACLGWQITDFMHTVYKSVALPIVKKNE